MGLIRDSMVVIGRIIHGRSIRSSIVYVGVKFRSYGKVVNYAQVVMQDGIVSGSVVMTSYSCLFGTVAWASNYVSGIFSVT